MANMQRLEELVGVLEEADKLFFGTDSLEDIKIVVKEIANGELR